LQVQAKEFGADDVRIHAAGRLTIEAQDAASKAPLTRKVCAKPDDGRGVAWVSMTAIDFPKHVIRKQLGRLWQQLCLVFANSDQQAEAYAD
jgi:hypothetical protein